MKTELTLNVLQTMNAQEYEDIRAAGSDERRELTHAVMRELDAPDNWTMNGEYGSEFGGFFPVQVRFTPAHERFHLALCSPGDVSQVWVLVHRQVYSWQPALPCSRSWPERKEAPVTGEEY